MKLDLRPRCARPRCGKLITKGRMAQDSYARYKPYCSYHCQVCHGTEQALAYCAELERREGS